MNLESDGRVAPGDSSLSLSKWMKVNTLELLCSSVAVVYSVKISVSVCLSLSLSLPPPLSPPSRVPSPARKVTSLRA